MWWCDWAKSRRETESLCCNRIRQRDVADHRSAQVMSQPTTVWSQLFRRFAPFNLSSITSSKRSAASRSQRISEWLGQYVCCVDASVPERRHNTQTSGCSSRSQAQRDRWTVRSSTFQSSNSSAEAGARQISRCRKQKSSLGVKTHNWRWYDVGRHTQTHTQTW